jgi:hypothetical protein
MFGPESCATVTIQLEKTEDNPTGLVVINESDFDAETMTKVDPVPEQAPSPATTNEQQPPAETGEKKVVAPWAQ